VRYADDSNSYVQSRRAGERVLAWSRCFLERRLRLVVNESKSAVARPRARSFLGYSMTPERRPRLPAVVREPARLSEAVPTYVCGAISSAASSRRFSGVFLRQAA